MTCTHQICVVIVAHRPSHHGVGMKVHTLLPNHITIVCVHSTVSVQRPVWARGHSVYWEGVYRALKRHHVYFHSCSVCFRSGQDVHFRRSFHFPWGNLSSFGRVEDVLSELRTALPPRQHVTERYFW